MGTLAGNVTHKVENIKTKSNRLENEIQMRIEENIMACLKDKSISSSVEELKCSKHYKLLREKRL